ncbi:metabotropic glutamate receptor [Caerostris extrusa]|uniref:Metabotropic glutamate receptor n=1 Tax=Caerostris extrusa TaxID=172846 RepID=A0AAV4SJ57_CAEEX|nr:metabotropic glutamate receptor [Caerostris extrusa]
MAPSAARCLNLRLFFCLFVPSGGIKVAWQHRDPLQPADEERVHGRGEHPAGDGLRGGAAAAVRERLGARLLLRPQEPPRRRVRGRPGICPRMDPIDGALLLGHLKNVSFRGLSGDEFHFSENGDGPARYNIIHFKQISGELQMDTSGRIQRWRTET